MKKIIKKIENSIKENVGYISITLAILGLMTIFNTLYRFTDPFSIQFLSISLDTPRLPLLYFSTGSFSPVNAVSAFNIFTIVINIFFLTASIRYIKQKDFYLLKFVYSLIYFYNWIMLISSVFVINLFENLNLSYIVHLIFRIILLYIVHVILKHFKGSDVNLNKKLKESNPKSASKYKRFLNIILDLFLCYLLITITSSLFPAIIPKLLFKHLGAAPTFLIYYFLVSLLYYTFFEFLLRRTPAKLLTGTAICSKEYLSISNIFKRSVESFLNRETMELNENKFKLIHLSFLPIVGLFFLLNYPLNEFRKDYVTFRKQKISINNQYRNLEYSLKNLKEGDVISYNNLEKNERSKYQHLVIKVTGNKIILCKIEEQYNQSPKEAYLLYLENPEKYIKIEVKKSYLEKGICKEYSYFNRFKGFNYFKGNPKMRLSGIYNFNDPNIQFDWMSYDFVIPSMFLICFNNYGEPCRLIKKEIMEGTAELDYVNRGQTSSDFGILFKKVEGKFKLKLTFENKNNSFKHIYIFENDGTFDYTLRKVN